MECYRQKFSFVRDESASSPVAMALARINCYRLVPRRLYFIDNSLAFGHREELILPG